MLIYVSSSVNEPVSEFPSSDSTSVVSPLLLSVDNIFSLTVLLTVNTSFWLILLSSIVSSDAALTTPKTKNTKNIDSISIILLFLGLFMNKNLL